MKFLPGRAAHRDMQVIKLSVCYQLLAVVNLINRFIFALMEFARAGSHVVRLSTQPPSLHQLGSGEGVGLL